MDTSTIDVTPSLTLLQRDGSYSINRTNINRGTLVCACHFFVRKASVRNSEPLPDVSVLKFIMKKYVFLSLKCFGSHFCHKSEAQV
jgi:hypothetical protein